jgi:hypothetical protein
MTESGGNTFNLDTHASNGTHNGIAQWDSGRWAALNDMAKEKGTSPFSLTLQLDYLITELSKDNIADDIKKASTIVDATDLFEQKIERSGGQAIDTRRENALKAFDAFSGQSLQIQEDYSGKTTTESCCSSTISSSSGTTSGSGRNNFMYHSGLPGADGSGSGKFIVEQYVIHVLKAIAKIKNVPEETTVTKEHVVALVTLALGEGGDIANPQKFNLFNSGWPRKDLLEGAHRGDGVQSFKSFDAGVTATAIHMALGDYQKRVGIVLSKKETTAKQVLYQISHYSETPGDLFWAEASKTQGEDNYYKNYYLNNLKNTVSSYKDVASYTIGTPNFSDQSEGSRDTSLLQFDAGGIDSTDDSGSSSSSSSSDSTVQAQCCAENTTNGSISGVAMSDPSDWIKIYQTNPLISQSMSKGALTQPKALIIHYTAGDSEGVNLLKWMGENSVGIQFNVGKDGAIYQSFPLNNIKRTNHVANANGRSIGIEITGKDVESLMNNDRQFNAVVALSKKLIEQYDIPVHETRGEITGLNDPSKIQGLLGHDEVPDNDHSDPDGKAGESIDRKDASKHIYMAKLRTSLGLDANPNTSSKDSSQKESGISSDCGGVETGDANMNKTISINEPGKFIKMPTQYSCSGRETKIDSRIASSLAYILSKYNMCADDGLANGHKSHGAGLGVDIRPKENDGSKEQWDNTAGRFLKDINWWGDMAIDPKGSKASCANYSGYGNCVGGSTNPDGKKIPQWVRWIGYNGDVDHGDPWHIFGGNYAHIHIGWDTKNDDGVSPSIISSPRDSVYTFPAPVPDDLKGIVE